MAKNVPRKIDAGSDATAGQGEELNLRELWRAVMRRKWVLAGTIVLITGATMAYVSQLTPRYAAETLVLVQARDAQVVNLDGVFDEFVAEPATIASEIELLHSPAFARRMVEELDLHRDPEFNAALRPEEPSFISYLNPLRYLPEEWGSAVAALVENDNAARPTFDPEVLGAALAPELGGIGRAAGAFRNRLEVRQVGRSYVLSIAFQSEDRDKAARVANATAEAYVAEQLQEKFRAAERAADWLRDRIGDLRQELAETESKIVAYRSEKRLTDPGRNVNPVILQMTQLNTQLALTAAQRAESEARLRQVRGLMNSPEGLQTAVKVLESPLMASLREQEAGLQRTMSELSTSYGERHPQMVALRADMESVHAKMEDEVQRILQNLENDVAVAAAREQELHNSLLSLEGDSVTLDLAEVELRNLTREAETNRELLLTFLTRFREITQQRDLQQADARVLSPAEVPGVPAYPQKAAFFGISFGASLLLGVLLIFLVERWSSDYGFRSADEIQSLIGLRALALVPDLTRRDAQGVPAEEYVLQKPNSAFSEALQRTRTNLFLANGDRPPKSVLITSSVPLEGKTTLAVALARQSARSGMKVLLIDADMRRPRLHEIMGVANRNGLSEVLTGEISRAEAIRRDERSGLDFMPTGLGVASPPDLFRAPETKRLMAELEAVYDLIMIDSPPVAAVSDSFILSGLVSKTVYVVRWEQTPRNVVLAGLEQMVEAGADIAGIVLSRVNVRKHARYGYADSGYYSGYYRRYYVN